MANQIAQPKSRVVDDRHIEEQARHLGEYLIFKTNLYSVYVPKKGQSKVQGVNQLQSSIGGVLKIEDNRKQGNFSDTASVVKQRFDYRDRQGADIFNFTNDNGQASAQGKRRNEGHQAVQNNGNLTYWNK